MKIEEIAHLANVSKSAVSLALNNKPGISNKTRERILKIVRDSGYLPRTMVNSDQVYGSSKIIRLLTCTKTDIVSRQYHSSTFFTEVLRSLEKKCREMACTLIYSSIDGNDLKNEIQSVERDLTSRGIILLGTNLTSSDIQIISEEKPQLVVLDNYFEHHNGNFIVMNNAQGAYTAAKYLITLGHRRIGYVQSNLVINNFSSRKRGFQLALKESSLDIAADDIFTVGADIELAYNNFLEILSKLTTPLPTALFCESDYIAIGVIRALQESGIMVPKDISIIGFDDVAQSAIMKPELTTIHVDKERMGEMAVQRLYEMIENKDISVYKTIIDTNLIKRNSCQAL